MSVSPPPRHTNPKAFPDCDFCIVHESGKSIREALSPCQQVYHPFTREAAWTVTRRELTREPLQTFRFEAGGFIACVGQPSLVLTGTIVVGREEGALYLHPRSPVLMSQGLQQWEPVDTTQTLKRTYGVLAHEVCQLRLQGTNSYVDFNVDPCNGAPIMYPFRDRPNQLLHLEPQTLRILHLSDTHSLHEAVRDLPAADLLVHTGDFTISGTDKEYEGFNHWLGRWKMMSRFKHCVVIAGNHEFHEPSSRVYEGQLSPAQVLDPSYVSSRLSNATFLAHEQVIFEGMRIFGSTWEPYSSGADPDLPGDSQTEQHLWAAHCASSPAHATSHKFHLIPEGVHLLLTHGPARGVLDWEFPHQAYGSSVALRERIVACNVKVHVFGHVHEQRGAFVKDVGGGYSGGVEYVHPQQLCRCPHPGPPAPDYPCDVISNNAMKNNKRHEAQPERHYIAGPPRMIIAQRNQGAGDISAWRFHLQHIPEQ